MLKREFGSDPAHGRLLTAGDRLRCNLSNQPLLDSLLLPRILLVLQHPEADGKDPSGNQETARKQDVNPKEGNTDKPVILKLGKSGNSYFFCETLVHGS